MGAMEMYMAMYLQRPHRGFKKAMRRLTRRCAYRLSLAI
jgi:hypothetical protein